MLYVARRSNSLLKASLFALLLGATLAVISPAQAGSESATTTLPPLEPPTYQPKTFKLPNFQMRQSSPLSERARIRLSETMIEHSLQLAVTNIPCDSTLSSAQCLEWLESLPETQAPRFASISLLSWAQTMPEIDAVLEPVVSQDLETKRWQMLRGLAIQARQTISKLTRDASQSDRTTPVALLNLNSEYGVARLEIVHRLVISGDRMMVDHMVIDRTASNPRAHKKIDQTTAQDLVDATDALKANVDASMRQLALTTTSYVAKEKIKK
jgi:hypothetical protein